MPNQNAIVAVVGRIEPQVEKQNAAELLRRSPDGVSIVFENDQTARLYPGDRAAGMLQILEQIRQMRAPVYVEVLRLRSFAEATIGGLRILRPGPLDSRLQTIRRRDTRSFSGPAWLAYRSLHSKRPDVAFFQYRGRKLT